MSLALGVWVLVAILSTAALIACLLGLVGNLRAMLRTLRRFKDEVEPVAREISDGSEGEGEGEHDTQPLPLNTADEQVDQGDEGSAGDGEPGREKGTAPGASEGE